MKSWTWPPERVAHARANYLIVETENRAIIQRRETKRRDSTYLARSGAVTLDPPGITLADLFD